MNSIPRRRLAAADRVSLWILTVGALLVTLAITVTAVVMLASAIAGDAETVAVGVYAPVEADSFPNSAEAQSGHFVTAELEASGLPAQVGVLLTVASLLSSVTYLIVAASTALLGWRLLRNDPFRTSVVHSILASSVALILGSSIAALVGGIGSFIAQEHLAGDAFMGQVPFTLQLDAAPVLIGIALGLVAGAFELGERMRADTVGLV